MSRKNELGFWGDTFFDDFFPTYRKNELTMKKDVKENEKNYELDIELPGVNKDNIDINLEDGYLNVSYRVENKKDDEHGKYIRKERYYGSMSRSYYVGDVNKENIEASYDNGVLTILVPKEEEPKKEVKKITIK